MPVRQLPSALAEKARIEINEDPQLLEESISHLKQWIKDQPHLRARTDDQWLAAFLRGCKFRLDKTKTKIDLYYSFRSKAPYLYSVKYFDAKFTDILNTGATLILPKTKNQSDPRVIFYRLGQYDPKKYTLMDIMSVIVLLEQICFMEDDNLVVSGTINVVDLSGAGLRHMTSTSFTQLRNLIIANEDAVPIRIKSVHFLNTPIFFETIFNFLKSFLNKKSVNKLMVHNKNVEALHEYIPKEILPEEYGGTGDSIQQCIDYWHNKINEYSLFYEDDLKYGTDESKRLSKCHEVIEPLRRLELD